MYRFNKNLLPPSFSAMFQQNNAIHTYFTRQAANIHLSNPRTVLAQKSIRHYGPDVWNSIPSDTRNLLTTQSFKRAVKCMLIAKMWITYYFSAIMILFCWFSFSFKTTSRSLLQLFCKIDLFSLFFMCSLSESCKIWFYGEGCSFSSLSFFLPLPLFFFSSIIPVKPVNISLWVYIFSS